ncbi:MAG: DUF3256 family protein [Paramuribaculum sp.]|nr:DUF3256 family protein [Paramuribaculum sp.]
MRLLNSIIALMIASKAMAFDASEAFVNAPANVFPLLDYNTRLDMVDYFNSGSSTASTNSLSGKSRITALSPDKVDIDMSDASDYSVFLLPDGKDGAIGVISTVATPVADSNLRMFTSDWSNDITSKSFTAPTLTDWLTPAGKKNIDEVETIVPFMTTSYAYNPSTKTLTVTNNTESFLTSDVYDTVRDYLLNTLTYKWDGKRFTLSK